MQRWLSGGLLGILLSAGPGLACVPAGGPPARESGGPPSAPEVGSAPGRPAALAAEAATSAASPALRQIEVPLASSAATITPFWVAADQGLFSRQGLEVELPYMPPATATQALSAGSVPIAAVGGSTVTAW